MFVVYREGDEVLVTTERREARMIKEWFSNTGRDIEEYDRDIINDTAVRISSSLNVR